MSALLYFLILQVIYTKNVIVVLCRNSELEGIKKSLISFEAQFNNRHKYPYIFFNDSIWDEAFKRGVRSVVSSDVKFEQISLNDWAMPNWINKNEALKKWVKLKNESVPYADSESYRNMCRWYSGKFFMHPSLDGYDYYWRIEPDVTFECEIRFDPFEEMAKHDYIYGFTIFFEEYMNTIPKLWDLTAEYIKENRDKIPKDHQGLSYMFNSKNGKRFYNGCHFWTNFEIGNLKFFRSPLYQKYIEKIDQSGQFYYDRVGDAPVHSLAVSELYGKKGIAYLEKIGYTHGGYSNCPANGINCKCNSKRSHNNFTNKCYQGYIKEKGNVL